MVKTKSRAFLIVGGLVAILIGLLATATLAHTVLAQTATPEATTPSDDAEVPALPFGRPGGFGHFGGRGGGGDEYLAAALGITVEELQAARDSAFAARLDDAVTAGQITQAQADALLVRQRLNSYIDRPALLAEAFGLSVDELQAALADGQSLLDLMTTQGLTAEALQANIQAAYEAAIARAVANGAITQAQADAYLSASARPNLDLFGGHGGFGGRGDHGGRGGHGGYGRGNSFFLPDDTIPDMTEPGFGA